MYLIISFLFFYFFFRFELLKSEFPEKIEDFYKPIGVFEEATWTDVNIESGTISEVIKSTFAYYGSNVGVEKGIVSNQSQSISAALKLVIYENNISSNKQK